MNADPSPKQAVESSDINAVVYTGRWPKLPDGGTFSPTTSTLVTGPTEAVLVDAQYLIDDVDDLGDLIERTGKSLTHIYLTHGHADHYLGFGPLLERFPNARCVATQPVVDYIRETMDQQESTWQYLFGNACVKPGPLPEALDGRSLYVDGSPLNIIDVPQADITPTTVVHVPAIDTVIAGDAVYNEIHPMLALSTPDEWEEWIAAIDVVESLKPITVVAGHKRPDSNDRAAQRMLDGTRQYIRDFAAALHSSTDADTIIDAMTAQYPRYGNLWTLQLSARAAFRAKSKA